MESNKIEKISIIAKMAQIASVLEVSGYPKPGNVHRTRDFADMIFEDFLISGVVIGEIVKEAALNGLKIKETKDFKNANLGKYIFKGVLETDKWVKNNTNLGILMMIIPISISAAISESFFQLQDNISVLMNNSTVNDAIDLYDAINLADAGGMGDQENFDVNSKKAKEELINNNQTMFDVLAISASWDSLARELTSKMPIAFDLGFVNYVDFKKQYSQNLSTVLTFLTILSNVPDTLISRKYGDEQAEEISEMAEEIITGNDDYGSVDFIKKVKDLDDYLFENKFNPGTTADLTAASIFLSYLYEYFMDFE
ncbi:triphosphoribosyl-dephospho-CoA synthase [Methanobrevibacter curvatus]|uniref:2-(5''-triphosphoribosyl)-3'-dephosphocoenzyme-A synthase n=1 Tax=Methanobrevibacter curvatus TaxID=49547 RepID=A0A162FGG8_9EURY|nr:triphosphoribosyl-dephospho-CoA synthase [Methanobrevibacter curvatus]KZX12695.1 2-(5''-triphosphoribosyl)-3'-dephosphocoenzyme-A synthase [Methanobrevibacter curvatus]